MTSKPLFGQDHLDYLTMLDEVNQKLDLMPSPMTKQECNPRSGRTKVGVYGKLNKEENQAECRLKVKTGILVDIENDCQTEEKEKPTNFGKSPLFNLDDVDSNQHKGSSFQRTGSSDSDKENGLAFSNPALGAIPKTAKGPRIKYEQFQNSSPNQSYVSKHETKQVESELLIPQKYCSKNGKGHFGKSKSKTGFETEDIVEPKGEFPKTKKKAASETVTKSEPLTSNHLKKNEELLTRKNVKRDFKKERVSDWVKDQTEVVYEDDVELVERLLIRNVKLLKKFDHPEAAKVVEDFERMLERRKVEDGRVFKAKSHQLNDWVKQQATIFAHRKRENEEALKKINHFLKKLKSGECDSAVIPDVNLDRSGLLHGAEAATIVHCNKQEIQKSCPRSDLAKTFSGVKKEDRCEKSWWQKIVGSVGSKMFRQRDEMQFLQNADQEFFYEVNLNSVDAMRADIVDFDFDEKEAIEKAKREGIILRLPTGKFPGTDKPIECVICMTEFERQDSVRYLPCMHNFHQICVDEWLMKSSTCPSCMQPIILD